MCLICSNMSFSSFINFNHIANSNCVSNSLKEPKAIYKNRVYSALPLLPAPSAILEGVEITDLFI